jgi:hypothetical protein
MIVDCTKERVSENAKRSRDLVLTRGLTSDDKLPSSIVWRINDSLDVVTRLALGEGMHDALGKGGEPADDAAGQASWRVGEGEAAAAADRNLEEDDLRVCTSFEPVEEDEEEELIRNRL